MTDIDDKEIVVSDGMVGRIINEAVPYSEICESNERLRKSKRCIPEEEVSLLDTSDSLGELDHGIIKTNASKYLDAIKPVFHESTSCKVSGISNTPEMVISNGFRPIEYNKKMAKFDEAIDNSEADIQEMNDLESSINKPMSKLKTQLMKIPFICKQLLKRRNKRIHDQCERYNVLRTKVLKHVFLSCNGLDDASIEEIQELIGDNRQFHGWEVGDHMPVIWESVRPYQ